MEIDGEVMNPCPFCGGLSLNKTGYDMGGNDLNFEYICCDSCRCHGPHKNTAYGDAIEAWNRRSFVRSPEFKEVNPDNIEFPKGFSEFAWAVMRAIKIIWPNSQLLVREDGKEFAPGDFVKEG